MKKLNLFAPINPLGYGVVGANLLTEFSRDLDVTLIGCGPLDVEPKYRDVVAKAQGRMATFEAGFNEAPCLKVWHEFSMADRIGKGPYYGFPFFEINKFDDRRINHLACLDHLFLASHWAKEVVRKDLKDLPITVVPLGVDRSVFNPSNNVVTDKCIFFNCGKWEKRKGHDILLEAFKAAFPNNESDVALHVAAENPFLPEKHKQEWVRYYRSDRRVTLIPRVATHEEVAKIMSPISCGIFPSRAEGWNLEALELMSMGKPLIITNYSSHTEFCNSDNSYLIDIDELEPAVDEVFFDGSSGEWAKLNESVFNQMVSHMRAFYESWKVNHNIINEGGIKTAIDLTWSKTANTIKDTIWTS